MPVSLRTELHAMLWVSALAALSVAVLSGGIAPSNISSNTLTSGSGSTASEARPTDPSDIVLKDLPRTLPPIDEEARLLFRVERPVQQEAVVSPPPAAPAPTPVLKGITSSGRELVAVFSADPNNPSTYLVVPVGGDVAGFTVLGVEPERVSIRSPAGVTTTLALRGTGEAQ